MSSIPYSAEIEQKLARERLEVFHETGVKEEQAKYFAENGILILGAFVDLADDRGEVAAKKLLVLLDWTQKTPLQPELGHRLRTGILDASRVPGIPATGHASVRPGGVSIHSEVEQSGSWISPL